MAARPGSVYATHKRMVELAYADAVRRGAIAGVVWHLLSALFLLLFAQEFLTFVQQGGTVFLSTHTLEVAEALCDRIAIVHRGKIRAHGSMDELRAEAKAGSAHLEEVFLKLTGSEQVAELVASLRPEAGMAGVERSAPEGSGPA